MSEIKKLSQAKIILTDKEDGTTTFEVHFSPDINNDSPAQQAATRIIEQLAHDLGEQKPNIMG